jgi:endoglucanase
MRLLSWVALGTLIASSQAWSGCLDAPRLQGVNTAGAEFNSGNMPGVFGKDYIYPSTQELTFISEQKATVIRLPIRWERVQRELQGPLDSDEVKRIRDTIDRASSKGLCVMVDIHNYAKYKGAKLADNPTLQDGFVDLWLRLAAEFIDADTTIFDLMNEPNYMPIADWAALAKRALAELRRADAKNVVMVAGGRWSGVHDWFTLQNNVSNATAFADLRDPLNRTVIEVHQYVDKDYSGTNVECKAPEKFDNMFQRINEWARTNQQKLLLGEFGVPQTTDCLATLDKLLTLMEDPVWRGWTYWAVGRWWNNYPMAINTNNEGISPQWAILKKYLQQSPNKKSAPKPPTVKR